MGQRNLENEIKKDKIDSCNYSALLPLAGEGWDCSVHTFLNPANRIKNASFDNYRST